MLYATLLVNNGECNRRPSPPHVRSGHEFLPRNNVMEMSRTAIYAAVARALGAREPDPSVRNPDDLAERLLGDVPLTPMDHPVVRGLSLPYAQMMSDVGIVKTVRMMIVRTRFIDDCLSRAIKAGATQVVVLGAGFDSHAYRCQELLAGVTVFEVDRPATQAWKRQRVIDVLVRPPANLKYVAFDLESEPLGDALRDRGYDAGARTFFILEGVTMYLSEQAADRTFPFIGAHPSGSAVAFDFAYRPLVELLAAIDAENIPETARSFATHFQYLTRDEPWRFGFPVAGEREFLAAYGLDVRESLAISGEESARRYLTKADGTQVGGAVLAAASTRAAERARAAALAGAETAPERTLEQQRTMAFHLAEAIIKGR